MATGYISTNRKYTPVEIAAIVKGVQTKHGTQDNFMGRMWAVATIMRESGGNSGIWGDDSNGYKSKGWWMWNGITNTPDSVAFDPVQSTEKAYQTTNGFSIQDSIKLWDPWINSAQRKQAGNPNDYGSILWAGTDNGIQRWDEAYAAITTMDPGLKDNPVLVQLREQLAKGALTPGLGPLDAALNPAGAIIDAAGAAIDPLKAVGEFFATIGGYIFDGSFWTRIGLGVAAVILVVFSAFLLFKDDIKDLPIPLPK